MEDQRRTAIHSGVDEFITKPCDEHELLERMQIALNIVYACEDKDDGDAVSGLSPLSAQRLGQLPKELIEELRQATLSGNKKLMDRLILKIGETGQPESAKALQRLADHYDYDALIQLLEG